VVELKGGKIEGYEVTPEQVDLGSAADGAVGAGTPDQNAQVLRRVLDGAPGPERTLAVMNAGAAIYAAGNAGDLREGVRAAERSIDSGAARDVMERYLARSRELGGEA
jgi:anthranilate phosphoribosyltransferase